MENVNLLVLGLTDVEKKLIQGVCRLSQRRTLTITLLDEVKDSVNKADVVLIDNANSKVQQFVSNNPNIINKSLIWVDKTSVSEKHVGLTRPVQWTQLVKYITDALEKLQSNNNVNNNQFESPNFQTENRKNNILVIDDSLVVRQQLTDVLVKRGFKVTTAESGMEALDVFKPDHFAKILLDVVMPDMDGYETCRQLKALETSKHSTPIIMLTSKSSPFDKIKGKMAGCDAYLTKPVSLNKLVSVLG